MDKVQEAKNSLYEFIAHAKKIHPSDGQKLVDALSVLQRLSVYGECSWHPGEYHGICSEAVR